MSPYLNKNLLSIFVVLILLFSGLYVKDVKGEIPGYPDYQNIELELQRLNHTHSKICALHQLGTTYEGRGIWALKISDNAWKEEDEPEVLIMGAHHAKELISAIVPLRFAEFLAGNYSSNSTVRNIVDSTEIWIVPLVNPDGYEYAWEGHTEWRKNRRPIDVNGDGIMDGIGVDLNRNYAHHWGEQGTTHDIRNDTDQTYCGPYPFSENETKAIRDLVLSHDFTFSVSFHSYGQIIYHPWGNSLDPEPVDYELMEAIGNKMAEYNGYEVMEGKEKYVTTGDSDDWIYANTTCLPFTVELGKEFIPPPNEINGIFGKNRDALMYLISIAKNPYLAISEEKTNLRIVHFSVENGTVRIDVDNQGNYSVSALLSISWENRIYTSQRFLLGAHESKNLTINISGLSGEVTAEIIPLHHPDEWDIRDNVAHLTLSEKEGKMGGNGDPLMYVFSTTILLFFLLAIGYKLFKKH